MRECGCRSHQWGGDWERSESEPQPQPTAIELRFAKARFLEWLRQSE
jgi:hypothetical protein